jgi:hypothetical protein
VTEEEGWIVGGDVDRISVSLRVFGDDLDPHRASSILGCDPTRAWRKGDARPGNRAPGHRNTGIWLLEMGYVPGQEFSNAVRKLFAQCTSDLDAWRSLHQAARLDLFCGIHLEEWHRGLDVDPDVLAILSDRGITLSLDISANSIDDEDDEPWKA